MQINQLSLSNFRNYGRLEVRFPLGATLLYGDNAQGKTNLLEALYYLATTRSPFSYQDQQLLNWDALDDEDPVIVSRLKADVSTAAGDYLLEMRLISERRAATANGQSTFRREALVNRRKVRLMDLLGNLRVVLFLPEDIQMITGPPSARRRFVDVTLCQIDRYYCRQLSRYNKVLEQRNAELRKLAEGPGDRDVLAIYSDKLAQIGSQVYARRAEFFEAIGRETHRIHYEQLTHRRETVRLQYLPQLVANSVADGAQKRPVRSALLQTPVDATAVEALFGQMLNASLTQDLARGATSVGPHRDDWAFWLDGRHLGHYGSRGQQRSAILALKMAEIVWMAGATNETPILLLDEVLAELDEERRALVLSYVGKVAQTIVTATDPAMFTPDFLDGATRMHIVAGQVTRQAESTRS